MILRDLSKSISIYFTFEPIKRVKIGLFKVHFDFFHKVLKIFY
jgi:hypothetical protein